MKRFMISLIAALIAAGVVGTFQGCATLSNQQATTAQQMQAIGEQGAIQFLTIAEIQKVAKNDQAKAKALAGKAHATIKVLNDLLSGTSINTLDFDGLHTQVTKVIADQHFDAATLVAVETVRNMVDLNFKDLKQNVVISPGNLTPQEIDGLKVMLSKIDEALILAGY